MTINVAQDLAGISVNNVVGAVKATVVEGVTLAPANTAFYGSYPKDTIDITSFPVAAGAGKWFGAVQAPNGKIYFIPHNSDTVLILDLVAGTLDSTTITGVPGASRFAGGFLAKNNKI